jgi:hypothetical protein
VQEDVVVVIEEIGHLGKLDSFESVIDEMMCVELRLRAKHNIFEGNGCDHAFTIRGGFKVPWRL